MNSTLPSRPGNPRPSCKTSQSVRCLCRIALRSSRSGRVNDCHLPSGRLSVPSVRPQGNCTSRSIFGPPHSQIGTFFPSLFSGRRAFGGSPTLSLRKSETVVSETACTTGARWPGQYPEILHVSAKQPSRLLGQAENPFHSIRCHPAGARFHLARQKIYRRTDACVTGTPNAGNASAIISLFRASKETKSISG